MNTLNPEKFLKNPVSLFNDWLFEAKKNEPNDPEAMALASVGADGKPSVRMVLLKTADENGFKFHTNTQSHKGQDIAQNPYVELCFYWKSLRKQIRVSGKAALVSEAESDEYFKTRPRARQIGAWASQQSETLDSLDTLENTVAEYEEKFAGQDIPRPPYWQGYRVVPERMEFWIGQKDRLHTRFAYVRVGDEWSWHWLNP